MEGEGQTGCWYIEGRSKQDVSRKEGQTDC